MTTSPTGRPTSPIPFDARLPGSSWAWVDPAAWEVTNAIVMARRTGLPVDPAIYVPTIVTSGGWMASPVSLTDVAEAGLGKLRAEGATDVRLVDRRTAPSETAPGASQTIAATVQVDGPRHDIRQVQAIFGYVDQADPSRTAVLVHTLSCAATQLEATTADLQRYLAGITLKAQPAS